MADYKDIIKGTLSNIAGKVKEVAESDTVQNFCGKVKEAAETGSVKEIYDKGASRASSPISAQTALRPSSARCWPIPSR